MWPKATNVLEDFIITGVRSGGWGWGWGLGVGVGVGGGIWGDEDDCMWSGGLRGACLHIFDWGGGGSMVCLCPPLLTSHFYFPLELYVYITLTNNYLTFFIYQLIILWTISIN